MKSYEVRFRVEAIRYVRIEASDSEEASNRAEDELRVQLGLDRKDKVFWLDVTELKREDAD